MNTRTLDLRRITNRAVGLPDTHLDIALTWCPSRPHEIVAAIRLHGTDDPTRRPALLWIIGRDLLTEGLDHPAGHGDITVLPDLQHPTGTRIELVLSPPSGCVAISLPVADLRAFLDETWQTVPDGAAPVADWDTAELAGGSW